MVLSNCASIEQQALNYSLEIDSKSDVQLCIDSAILGVNEEFLIPIKSEIERRELNCEEYSEQVESVRGVREVASGVFGVLWGLLSIMIGLAVGAQ